MHAESLYIIHRNPADGNRWSCQLYGVGIAFSYMEHAEREMSLLLGEDCFSYYGQLSEAQAIAAALNSEGVGEGVNVEKETAMLDAYREACASYDRLAHHILAVVEDAAKDASHPTQAIHAGMLVWFAKMRKHRAKLESVNVPPHFAFAGPCPICGSPSCLGNECQPD